MLKRIVTIGLIVFIVSSNLAVRAQTDTPIYKDASRPVAERVKDLMVRMTLDEKIGQMTLVEKNSIKKPDIAPMGIGALLSGGGGFPSPNTVTAWAQMVDGFQKEAMSSRLGIPLLYGVDAVHGHNNMQGTVIFPHNIGLGAANDPDLVKRIGMATGDVTVATGIYWDYAPVVAVVQDVRWGRTYESYGENTELVSKLSSAMIKGLQREKFGEPGSVLASVKHFVGDGGTQWGSSATPGYKLDQGVTNVDEATLRAIHLPPYIEAIKNGARNIMVSYSSWGGLKMHAQKYLITDVLKGELGFTGFVVSDWEAIDQIAGQSVKIAINAGVDMNMVPTKYTQFITTLKALVESGEVSQERIDDAVRRILTVKFELGLFEHPYSDPSRVAHVGSAAQRALGREAVAKSMVLLQNNNKTLPLPKTVLNVLVAGTGANNIGMQSGGWTIDWQGKLGNITPGTTILQAIQGAVGPATVVTYDPRGRSKITADVGIVVIGEDPYAEGRGDSADLAISPLDATLIENVRARVPKLIVILLSGRPMIIGKQLNQSDAFIAAWLPGTEGQGVADVIFGDRQFTGKLPFTWPRAVTQLPFDFKKLSAATGCDAPLFPFGYGLNGASETTVRDECLQKPN